MSIADKLTTIAENVPKVYEAGRQKEYDEFWDIFQQNGNRTNYEYAFAGGKTWTDSIFKPKYTFKPQYAAYMFTQCGILNLKSCLAKNGLTLDFSNTANLLSAFAWNDSMVAIGKFKVSSVTTNYASTFAGCNNLQDIEFEGEIVSNIDLSASKVLSKASIESLINTLSASTSGKTATISATAKNNAFTTAEWNTLVATKTNWTISLV